MEGPLDFPAGICKQFRVFWRCLSADFWHFGVNKGGASADARRK